MKYFINTEFIEGSQTKRLLSILIGKTKPTIDLISIGIKCEDGREYYAISKDFNLKEAWNRYDKIINKQYPLGPEYNKVYWLRDNVLNPIFNELFKLEYDETGGNGLDLVFSYSDLIYLIDKYGKSNYQISEEVYNFCSNNYHNENGLNFNQRKEYPLYDKFKPEFYGYYSYYDWVVFCWLFGKMINLPNGFPKYCIDLKQELERLNEVLSYNKDEKEKSYSLQEHKDYPILVGEHNALNDAKWNKQLYEFLIDLIP